jgi:hypothetical protein
MPLVRRLDRAIMHTRFPGRRTSPTRVPLRIKCRACDESDSSIDYCAFSAGENNCPQVFLRNPLAAPKQSVGSMRTIANGPRIRFCRKHRPNQLKHRASDSFIGGVFRACRPSGWATAWRYEGVVFLRIKFVVLSLMASIGYENIQFQFFRS